MAKWELDCATNLNPKFEEAIELKEEITGHEVTQCDNSSMRSFVRRAMLTDVVPSTQPVGRTAYEDADQQSSPSTQPTETASTEALSPATQPTASTEAEMSESNTTDVADSLKNQDAATAEAPTTAPVAGTAEASAADDSVAIPSTTQPTATTQQSTEIPEDAADSKDLLTDPLATPSNSSATQPSSSTTVTPLEDEVPGAIKDESSSTAEQN